MRVVCRAYLVIVVFALLILQAACNVQAMPVDLDKKITREIDDGRFDAALSDLDTMEKFAPVVDLAWVYSERGFVFAQQRNYAAAAVEVSKAIAIDGKEAAYFNNRAFAYEKLGRIAEAEADYTSALTLEPQKASRYAERAAFFLNVGRLEDALQDTEQALVLDPKEPLNYLRRADIRMALRQFDRRHEIIADLRKVLELQQSGALGQSAAARLRSLEEQP